MEFRCYKRDDGMWGAYMVYTKTGEAIGPEMVAEDNETAVFKLGVMYGAHLDKFAQPLDMIIPVEN